MVDAYNWSSVVAARRCFVNTRDISLAEPAQIDIKATQSYHVCKGVKPITVWVSAVIVKLLKLPPLVLFAEIFSYHTAHAIVVSVCPKIMGSATVSC